jgi:phospholipid/cholesterol/gamma-HCH transport system ATP-binding protein
MVFQYAALFDSMNTFDNVAFPLKEFTNLTKSQIKLKVEELLISVGLNSESFLKLPSELSGGMRKRVGLARALALSPKIMLYDEPTTGLDPITTKMVNDLIKETSDKNKHNELTSIIISHDVQATLKISDYIAFLEKGTIVEYLAVEEFVKSQNPTIRQFLDLSF